MKELLDKLNIFLSDSAFLDDLLSCLSSQPIILSFLNAHAVNMAYDDPDFETSLLASDYLLRDGVGIELALNIFKRESGYNLNGTDLIPEVIRQLVLRDYKLLLFGTTDDACHKASKKLAQDYNAIVLDYKNGFLSNDEYLSSVRSNSVDNQKLIVILGMGMPKQEKLSIEIKSLFYMKPIVIVNGGAIIDFLSGKVARAPSIFRRLRIEWIYRLIREPRRLFKRYVWGNFIFMLRVFSFK